MAKTFGKYVGRTALFLAAGLALLVLFGAALAPADGGESSVRMAVDPTVLPPVLPPDAPPAKNQSGEADPAPETAPPAAPANEESPVVTVVGPSVEPAPEAASQPKPAPQAAPAKPAQAPAPKPAQAAAPAPAPKPAPAKPVVAKPEPQAPPAKPAPEPAPEPAPAKPAQAIAPAPRPAPAPAPAQAAKPAPDQPGTVRRIALESTDHGFTLTLTCDRPVGDTTYMNLTNPRRLVVDLRAPWKLGTRNVARADTGMVRHVVVGEHPDRLRFVIHFRTPPKGALTPEFRRDGNTLTVTVNTD